MQVATPSNENPLHIPCVDVSVRIEGSVTRELADQLVVGLAARAGEVSLTWGDVVQSLPFGNAGGVAQPHRPRCAQRRPEAGAGGTRRAGGRGEGGRRLGDLGTPLYNFGVPASLTAWVEQIARARQTFRYTEQGPRAAA